VGLFGGLFKGEKLKFGDRATFVNVPPHKADQIWSNERILFEIEREVIENYIANEVENRLKNEQNPNKDSVWKDIENKIREFYIKTKEIDTKLIERVKNREFAKITPSEEEIRKWWVFFLGTLVAETSVIALQAVFGGAGFNLMIILVIIIYSILLGGGGFFLGQALGLIMKDYEFAKRGELTKENRSSVVDVLLSAIFGILAIAFVAVVRSFSVETPREKFTVIGITVLLGLLVALTDGYRKKLSELRKHFLEDLQRGLEQIATKLHSEMLDSYRITFERVWEENVKKKFGESKENQQEVKG